MSNDQLVTLFKHVNSLRGVLQIWNSQLTSATFMKNIQNITGDPLDKGISILNNTKLASINLTSLKYSNGKIEIQNNPILNLQKSCSVIHYVYFNRRSITGNLFDCGCEITGFFQWPKIKNFPENCIVLYGNIIMDGIAPPHNALYRLATVTKLYGFISIKRTNLETLGFLQNLEDIESGVEAENTIVIEANYYLGRLDLIRLQSIKSRNPDSDVTLENNGELCIDPSFIQLLAHSSIRYIKQYSHISFCGLDKINNPSTYCTGKLSTINERCTRYIGDILYSNPSIWDYSDITNYTKIPQNEIRKFQQFEIIYGSLLIEGSTLTNISMPNLREIYQVADVYMGTDRLGLGIAMKFRRNDFLKEVYFPNLKISHNSVLFRLNGNLTTDPNFCKKMTEGRKRMTLLGLDADYDCRPYSLT